LAEYAQIEERFPVQPGFISASKGLAGGTPVQERKERRMLVLSRKKNESIVINDDITIVVVDIRGDKVRLGVEAPKEIPVHRREVFEAIRRSQAEAANKPTSPTPPSNPS